MTHRMNQIDTVWLISFFFYWVSLLSIYYCVVGVLNPYLFVWPPSTCYGEMFILAIGQVLQFLIIINIISIRMSSIWLISLFHWAISHILCSAAMDNMSSFMINSFPYLPWYTCPKWYLAFMLWLWFVRKSVHFSISSGPLGGGGATHQIHTNASSSNANQIEMLRPNQLDESAEYLLFEAHRAWCVPDTKAYCFQTEAKEMYGNAHKIAYSNEKKIMKIAYIPIKIVQSFFFFNICHRKQKKIIYKQIWWFDRKLSKQYFRWSLTWILMKVISVFNRFAFEKIHLHLSILVLFKYSCEPAIQLYVTPSQFHSEFKPDNFAFVAVINVEAWYTGAQNSN